MPRGLIENLHHVETFHFNIKSLLKLANKYHERYLLRNQLVDYENAVDYFLRVLKMAPDIAEPYYKLASLMWDKGQVDISNALKQCKKAILLEPYNSSCYLYYGYFLKNAGLRSQAIFKFKRALRIKPSSSKTRLATAFTYSELVMLDKTNLSNYSNMLYYFISALPCVLLEFNTLKFGINSLLHSSACLYFRAKGRVLQLFKKYDKAVKNYEYAARNTASPSYFYLKAGDSMIKSGCYGEAVESYKKALKHSPENFALWAKLAMVLKNYCEDSPEQLIECYSKLLQNDPFNARLYYELGHLYMKINDKFSALNSFKRTIEIEPENPFYHNSYAYALIQLKHYEEALLEYKKAIKLNPDNKWTSIVCQAQGAIYHQIFDNLDAAVISYEAATVLDSKNADAYFALGEIYYENGDLDNAIDNYCESLKINNGDARIYCSLGKALWDKDCIDEAIVALERSISFDGGNNLPYLYLGMIYLDGVGDVEKSLKFLMQSLKYNPSSVIAYFNIGKACQIKGEMSSSAQNFQMAYDLNKITNEMEEGVIEEKLYNLFKI